MTSFCLLIISVDKDEAVREEKAAARKSMKEVEESAGLLERPSDDDLDDEVKLINGFDLGTPLTLQATQHVTGNFYLFFHFLLFISFSSSNNQFYESQISISPI